MSDEQKKKIAVDCWKRGSQAVESQSWDYAIAMFGTAVKQLPDNLLYRQTLRVTERKKYNDNRKGAKLAGFKITKLKASIKAASMKSNWVEVDKLAEEGLALNPWDAGLNASLGEAASKRGFHEIAEFSFQQSVEMDPKNKDYIKKLADVQEERGKFKEAARTWARILEFDPIDGEARTKSQQLDTQTVINRGGYEDAENTHDVEVPNAYDVDRPVKQQIPEAVTGPGEDKEADLRRAVRKNPEEKDAYLKLAQFLQREKRLPEARETLAKALEFSLNDKSLQELIEDLDLEIMKQEIENFQQENANLNENKKLQTKLKQKQRDYLTREIEVFKNRVEEYPKDLHVKFRLAKSYIKGQKFSDAIPLLQQASSDPKMQADVLVNLGKCFFADGKKKLALPQFEKAITLLDEETNTKTLTEVHYLCGRLYEQAKKPEQAEEHYLKVLGYDYDYKDANDRLENLSVEETE